MTHRQRSKPCCGIFSIFSVVLLTPWLLSPNPANAETPGQQGRQFSNVPVRSAPVVFSKVEGREKLSLPSDVAVSPSGSIYVVDGGNHRIVEFSRGGDWRNSFGGQGSKPGKLQGPLGIGIDGNNRIYVADKGNNRIQIFDSKGRFISQFRTLFRGKAVMPADVAVTANGNRLFVTSNATHAILVYSSNGKLLRHWGGEGVDKGRFRYPATIAIGPKGEVYVVDVLNSRVQVFDQQGNHVVDVGAWGALPGEFVRPKGVAVDNEGNVYVSDSYLEVIQVFDKFRRFSHVLGNKGKPMYLTAPTGIAVNARGQLFVTEMLKHEVSAYDLKP